VANSYYPPGSGYIQLILQPQWIEGFENRGTTRGAWNPYGAHIPLPWFCWNIRTGKNKQ
jgi:hypothetical protein